MYSRDIDLKNAYCKHFPIPIKYRIYKKNFQVLQYAVYFFLFRFIYPITCSEFEVERIDFKGEQESMVQNEKCDYKGITQLFTVSNHIYLISTHIYISF